MMSVWHLMWIIPMSFWIGMIVEGFMAGATQSEREYEAYQKGVIVGVEREQTRMNNRIEFPICYTLEELYDRGFNSDFNKFTQITGGIIYGVEESGQMSMIYVDDTDTLNMYFDKPLLLITNEGEYQRPIIEASIK